MKYYSPSYVGEKFNITVDFVNLLQTNEVLLSATVSADTGVQLVGTPGISGTSVIQTISPQTAGTSTFIFTVNTSLGNTYIYTPKMVVNNV